MISRQKKPICIVRWWSLLTINLHFSIEFCLFVHDILLDQFLLCFAEVQMLHFWLEHVPCLFSLTLVRLELVVAALDVGFGILSLFFHLLRYVADSAFRLLGGRRAWGTCCCCCSRCLLLVVVSTASSDSCSLFILFVSSARGGRSLSFPLHAVEKESYWKSMV